MDVSEVIVAIKSSIPVVLIADNNHKIISKGSGFIYRDNGCVVTCAHVVKNEAEESSIFLKFADSDEFISAKIAITDHEHDIALLKFTPDKKRSALQPSPSSNKTLEGSPVIFSGYPFTLMDLTTHQGIISSIIKDPTGVIRYLIDGTVNSGNSGGPLMDTMGRVIGVIDATRRESTKVLSKVEAMSTGAVSLHGLDLVEIYNALLKNIQLGMGYAVPSSYIPEYRSDTISAAQPKPAPAQIKPSARKTK